MASSSDQGISDLILLWLKLELVDPAGSNTLYSIFPSTLKYLDVFLLAGRTSYCVNDDVFIPEI
jgi:hypothetical protein